MRGARKDWFRFDIAQPLSGTTPTVINCSQYFNQVFGKQSNISSDHSEAEEDLNDVPQDIPEAQAVPVNLII